MIGDLDSFAPDLRIVPDRRLPGLVSRDDRVESNIYFVPAWADGMEYLGGIE
jgi:hypothetical protein